MLKKIVGLIVVILVLLAGWVFWHWHSKAVAVVKVTPPLVKMSAAVIKNKPQSITAIGTVVAPKDVTLMAQQAGIITAIHFKSGQQVKKGQLLFSIDSVAQKAALEQKQAALTNSEAQYKRYLKLSRQNGVISKESFDQVKSTYLLDLAAVKEAKQAYDQTSVRAPFSGSVSAPQPVRGKIDNSGNSLSNITQISVGSYVGVSDPLVELVDKQHLVIQYSLPQHTLHSSKLNQAVVATTNAYPGISFKGKVVYISPSLNTVNRTFVVRASVDNHLGKLSPGMLMTTKQVINPNAKVLLIPAISLMMDLQGYHVYILKNGVVASRVVTVGERYDNDIAVLSGLKPGMKVISRGVSTVKEGEKVRVAK